MWTLFLALVPLGVGLILSRPLVAAWAVLVTTMVSLRTLLPAYDIWPVHFVVPLLLSAGYLAIRRGPAPSSSWAARGSFEPGIKILTFMVAALAALGFVAWVALVRPAVFLPPGLHNQPAVVLIATGCAFALVNAGIEELAFRGLALHALTSALRTKTIPILLQAAAFGALHAAPPSMPYGLGGVTMTFVYGAALGVLAVLSDGILAAWVAHAIADLLVFFVLVGWM